MTYGDYVITPKGRGFIVAIEGNFYVVNIDGNKYEFKKEEIELFYED